MDFGRSNQSFVFILKEYVYMAGTVEDVSRFVLSPTVVLRGHAPVYSLTNNRLSE